MRRDRSTGPWGLLGIAAALGLSACSAAQTTIVVTSKPDTNQRLPFYVLVRTVDSKAFLSESYPMVAGKVTTPDASVLGAQVIFPGYRKEIQIARPEKTPLAVYFLFTKPGRSWRTLVELPVPAKVGIDLEGDRILKSTDGK